MPLLKLAYPQCVAGMQSISETAAAAESPFNTYRNVASKVP